MKNKMIAVSLSAMVLLAACSAHQERRHYNTNNNDNPSYSNQEVYM